MAITGLYGNGYGYSKPRLFGAIGAGLYNSSRTRQKFRPTGGRSITITRNRKKKPVSRMSFKKMVYSTEQAKHYTGEVSAVLKHNVLYTMCPTQGIVQGNTATTRIGDEVYLAALKINALAVTDTSSNAYKYRILVGWTGEEYSVANIQNTFPEAQSSAQTFHPSTASLIMPNGVVNAKAFTVLHDQSIDINSQISGVADWQTVTVNVPLEQVFNYQSAASVQGKTRNLVVLLCSSVAGGTNTVTSTGSMVVSFDLIFK